MALDLIKLCSKEPSGKSNLGSLYYTHSQKNLVGLEVEDEEKGEEKKKKKKNVALIRCC